MYNLGEAYSYGTSMAVVSEGNIAVGCVLAHMCKKLVLYGLAAMG